MDRPVAITLAAVLLAGCSTVDSRIKEHADLFASLPADAQDRLRRGGVEVGDSKDMVYIALGRPHRVHRFRDETGVRDEVWAYLGYYYTQATYWPRHHVHRRRHGDDFDLHFHGPEWVDIRHEYERLRIYFKDDRVTAIEETTR